LPFTPTTKSSEVNGHREYQDETNWKESHNENGREECDERLDEEEIG
jgi:hypothetical protein